MASLFHIKRYVFLKKNKNKKDILGLGSRYGLGNLYDLILIKNLLCSLIDL